MAEGSDRPEWLVVGQITKAHGVKGELLVWPLTDSPEATYAPGRRLWVGEASGELGESPLEVEVEGVRPYRRGLLVSLAGYESRDAVEELLRRYVLLPADELEPREEGEVFYHELLDSEVVTVDGAVVGRVREVYETEPAHLLEVKGERGVHLVPFTRQIVKQVEPGERIVIDPPEGLLDV